MKISGEIVFSHSKPQMRLESKNRMVVTTIKPMKYGIPIAKQGSKSIS